MENKDRALRFNEGKVRYDLVPAWAYEQVARVFTYGAKKYSDHNWRKGMPWSEMIASMERHLQAIKAGEDYNDKDFGLLNSAHLAWNAIALTEYYKIYPQGDNRVHGYNEVPKIALDIDEVICDFLGGYSKVFNISKETLYWNFSYKIGEHMEQLKSDKDFWLGLDKLRDVPFEPEMYVTSRNIPTEWTMEWLEANKLPCRPVVTVPLNTSKVGVLKEHNIDILIDDKYANFLECSKAGIFTYLMDCPHNQHYKVGHKRIYDLNILNL